MLLAIYPISSREIDPERSWICWCFGLGGINATGVLVCRMEILLALLVTASASCDQYGMAAYRMCQLGAVQNGWPATMERVDTCNRTLESAREECSRKGLPGERGCWVEAERVSEIVRAACEAAEAGSCDAWALGVQAAAMCGS